MGHWGDWTPYVYIYTQMQVFGDIGRHARSAVGVSCLPFGVTTEVEAVVEASRNPTHRNPKPETMKRNTKTLDLKPLTLDLQSYLWSMHALTLYLEP